MRERELLELLAAAPERRPLARVDETSIAQIQLTSGTSTEPRGVMLTHGTLIGQATALADALELHGTDVILNPNPLFHVSGQFFSLAALSRGACQIVAPYDPEHLLDVIDDRAGVGARTASGAAGTTARRVGGCSRVT